MAKITMKDISPELTAEEIRELELAEQKPIVFDEDCPEMTVEQLLEFKQIIRRERQRNGSQN